MKNKMMCLLAVGLMSTVLLAGCSAAGDTKKSETVSAEPEKSETEEKVTETAATEIAAGLPDSADGSSTLVVYFSAQGHTVDFAQAIAEELNADTFEIVPVDEYTEEDLNWRDENSRVSREHADSTLQDIELVSTEVDGWENYDTVFIGFPTWWQNASWVVNNFVKDNDFTGKTVVPFTTSQASGLGDSGKNLEEMAGSGNWLEGKRFASNEDTANAREWAASIVK